MAFMSPVTEFFVKSDLIENDNLGFTCNECRERKHDYNICASGDGHIVCSDCCPPEEGWYSRLSAAGYMDATDWHGPYKTSEQALKEVMDVYEVDENGDSLEQSN